MEKEIFATTIQRQRSSKMVKKEQPMEKAFVSYIVFVLIRTGCSPQSYMGLIWHECGQGSAVFGFRNSLL
jgi:hypothetical protein